jgi:MbtH protein
MDGFKNFRVVFNHEQQYSIWPQEKTLPQGWTVEGVSGTKQDCLDHISTIWKDIRPQSLKQSIGTS